MFIARRLPGLTRSRVKKLIEEGQVTVDGDHAKASHRLDLGQRVIVDVPPARDASAEPPVERVVAEREQGDLARRPLSLDHADARPQGRQSVSRLVHLCSRYVLILRLGAGESSRGARESLAGREEALLVDRIKFRLNDFI